MNTRPVTNFIGQNLPGKSNSSLARIEILQLVKSPNFLTVFTKARTGIHSKPLD